MMGRSVHRFRWLGILIAIVGIQYAGAGGAQAGLIGLDRSPAIFIDIQDESGASLWTSRPPIAESRSASRDGWGLPPGLAHVIIDRPGRVPFAQADRGVLDQSVFHNMTFENVSGATMIFDVTSSLPIGAFPAPNFIRGTITTSVIDGGLDGATIAATGGSSIYQAQIDGATVRTMQDAPFSLTALVAGSTAASESFGFEPNGVAVVNDIGIRLRFSLTAGDTASILSRFDISAVPEPASLYAFGVALTMVAVRRRRVR